MKAKFNIKQTDRVFDLIDANNLKGLGLVESQLMGPIGRITLDTLKDNAKRLGYHHFAFRDPIRPGAMWVENLETLERSPWRTLENARLVDRICPGLIESWERSSKEPLDWDMIYPPVHTPPMQYCTALEWLIRKYPDAVVAWVELALTYENELGLNYAVSDLFKQCRSTSNTWGVVAHVLGVEFGVDGVAAKDVDV